MKTETAIPPLPRFSCMPNELARMIYSRLVASGTGTAYQIGCPYCGTSNSVPVPDDRFQRTGWFRRVYYSIKFRYAGWASDPPQQYGVHGQPICWPSVMHHDLSLAFKLGTCQQCGKRFHFNATWTEVLV